MTKAIGQWQTGNIMMSGHPGDRMDEDPEDPIAGVETFATQEQSSKVPLGLVSSQ